jgi:L-erythrulose 1-kinase
MGKMLISAGATVQGCNAIGAKEFRMMLDSMEGAVAKTGKTQPGDKTILDSIHGAREAISGSDASLQDLVMIAAKGADAGAHATAQMRCRAGRGSKLGDRVLGCPDPGAVSFSIILQAVSDWFESRPSTNENPGAINSAEEKA